MKYAIAILVMLTACGHKAVQPTIDLVDASPPVDAQADVQPQGPTTITSGSWSFSLPDNTWVKSVEGDASNVLSFSNSDLHTNVAFFTEKYTGTQAGYVIFAMRGLKDSFSQIKSVKQVSINGSKFSLIETYKHGITTYTWVSLVNGEGVGWSCGGPYGDVVVESLCKHLAETLTHG